MIKLTSRNSQTPQYYGGLLTDALNHNMEWIKRCFENEHGQWRQTVTEISVKKSLVSGGSATYDVFTKTAGVSPRVAQMTIAVKAEYKHPITGQRIEQSIDISVVAPESEWLPTGTVLYSNNSEFVSS